MLVSPIRRVKKKRDIGSMLTEQLQEYLGSEHLVSLSREKPWASITFSGTRFLFEIASLNPAASQASNQRLEQLPDHEFRLPGQFVADVLIQPNSRQTGLLTIEILAIADPVSD